MPIATASNEEFIAVWRRSATVGEVARRLGMTNGACRTRASLLRRKGHAMKAMPPWRGEFIAVLDVDNTERRPVETPTRARPGTAAKVRVLVARVRNGEELWHPEDRKINEGEMTNDH